MTMLTKNVAVTQIQSTLSEVAINAVNPPGLPDTCGSSGTANFDGG